MIIQCIPGSGKTHLAKRFDEFVDSDDIMAEFGLKGKAGFDAALKDPTKFEEVRSALLAASRGGRIVMCNFDPVSFGLPCKRRFTYSPDDYVAHLTHVGRKDLLDRFDKRTLRDWASDYLGKDNVTVMTYGTFVADYKGELLMANCFQ